MVQIKTPLSTSFSIKNNNRFDNFLFFPHSSHAKRDTNKKIRLILCEKLRLDTLAMLSISKKKKNYSAFMILSRHSKGIKTSNSLKRYNSHDWDRFLARNATNNFWKKKIFSFDMCAIRLSHIAKQTHTTHVWDLFMIFLCSTFLRFNLA